MTAKSESLRRDAAKLLERAELIEGFHIETEHARGPSEYQSSQWFEIKYGKLPEHCAEDADGYWTCYGQSAVNV